MTDRLTRSQRKKIEDETHKKLDLDKLADINVKDLVEHKQEESTEQTKETAEEQASTSEKTNESINNTVEEQEVTEEKADESSNEDQEDSSDESSSGEEEEESDSDSSDEEDVDLDDLLSKAQSAAKANSADILLEKSSEEEDYNKKLSKLETGIQLNQELYLKKVDGRTKLVPDAVALVDDDIKPTKKAAVVLKQNKKVEQPLSRKERQAEREKTTGKAWFDMPKAEMTDEVKRDLQVLKMRHILDRKRHYKKMGKTPDPKYFQVGTIIESPTEFFSARINKKDRKQTIVDELMASDELKQYYKRKYTEVNERTTSGGKKHYKKLKAQRQWAK